MNGPKKHAGQAGDLAGSQNRKIGQTIANQEQPGKPRVDITDRARQMPRNAAILYPNPPPRSGEDWAHFRGVLKLLHDGKMFWVGLWPRTVNGKLVYEIRLTPKTEEERHG